MIYPDDIVVKALERYDQAEAYVSETVVRTVYIDGSRISNVETKTDSGMMFRMIDGSRAGKSSVSLNREGAAADCLDMAESVLRHSPVNEGMEPYAHPAQARIAVPDVWDKRVEDMTADGLREIAKRVIDSCDAEIPRAQIRLSCTESRTVNSNGVDVGHRSTLVYGHFTSMAVGEHPGEGMESYHGARLDLDPEHIGRELSRKAWAAAGSREYKGSEKLTMVLPPSEMGDMLVSSVGAAVNGENLRYGRTMWKDSLGEQVASQCLSICDDPSVPAPLSCAFDDEGAPASRKRIVEDGVLKGFLRDSFCGDSTGNGMRRSSVEPQGAYDRTPTIKPLNMAVRPGTLTREQIVEQTDSGILVEKFAWPEADELTGRFGLNVRCGYLIRRGEIVGAVSNALLMGNMLEAVRNIEAIGNDPVQTGVATVPTMSFSGAELAGNRGVRA